LPSTKQETTQKSKSAPQSPNPAHIPVDNKELEEETMKMFDGGGAVAVFPEGTSHSESHLMKLKGMFFCFEKKLKRKWKNEKWKNEMKRT